MAFFEGFWVTFSPETLNHNVVVSIRNFNSVHVSCQLPDEKTNTSFFDYQKSFARPLVV